MRHAGKVKSGRFHIKDVGWRIPSSGEVILAKIKSEEKLGMLILTRVSKGSILAAADNIYVINQNDRLPGFDLSLEAGRLTIESLGGTSAAVKITALDEKGFVISSALGVIPILPVGTEFEIETQQRHEPPWRLRAES